MINFFITFIPCTYSYRLLVVKHIELSHYKRIYTANPYRKPYGNSIKPAAPPWPAGSRAEFSAFFLNMLSLFTNNLCWKRTTANPGCIRLRNPDYIVNLLGR